mmetsp:Transcript_44989/g.104069  ORF Transcript_44989/g.104069 Transcript_44989/m.104069 type:complete len:412 (-) Transcript_44989:24-1259(-)
MFFTTTDPMRATTTASSGHLLLLKPGVPPAKKPQSAHGDGGARLDAEAPPGKKLRSVSGEAWHKAEDVFNETPVLKRSFTAGPVVEGFMVGERVRYWSASHGKWIDAHVQHVNKGPGGIILSYDLTAKPQAHAWKVRASTTPSDTAPPSPPPRAPCQDRLQATPTEVASFLAKLRTGDKVKYLSKSKGTWVDATVESSRQEAKGGATLYDLNCKKGVPADRLRRVPERARVLHDVGERVSIGALGRAAIRVGDQLQYWSESKARWLEAVVERVQDKHGSPLYDLNCKKGVSGHRLRHSLSISELDFKVGDRVEYWSSSTKCWLLARVLRLRAHLGQCDLDLKLGAALGRLRRVARQPSSGRHIPDGLPEGKRRRSGSAHSGCSARSARAPSPAAPCVSRPQAQEAHVRFSE